VYASERQEIGLSLHELEVRVCRKDPRRLPELEAIEVGSGYETSSLGDQVGEPAVPAAEVEDAKRFCTARKVAGQARGGGGTGAPFVRKGCPPGKSGRRATTSSE
jgi:hypothetical protein